MSQAFYKYGIRVYLQSKEDTSTLTLPSLHILFTRQVLSDQIWQQCFKNVFNQSRSPSRKHAGSRIIPDFTASLPCTDNIITATFTDDTDNPSSHDDPVQASFNLHNAFNSP